MKSAIIFSDSLDAVQFHITIKSILYSLINLSKVASASSTLFCGAVG